THHLDLLGFDVDASGSVQFFDKANAVITDAQFFGQLTDQSIVRATGSVSGSVLTANRLEIE
ncbi:MAG: hypothetical protein KKG47_07525, partial [Proteobacteria bacterium]|nr:hypothetical protein [Pseudomonadota bacterium]